MRKFAFVLALVATAAGIFAAARRRSPRHGIVRFSTSSKLSPPLAPQLVLTDLNNQVFNTSALKGKVVVVNFWAAWCTPCAEEVPKFIAMQEKYRDQGLQIIGISIDDSGSELRGFYHRYGVNYPVIEGSPQIVQAYGGILGLPTTFIIGRDGRIEKKLTGATDFADLEKDVAAYLSKS